ncbi:MAG TPA: acetyl-CoA hydrolase/transferase C-terminal domain-containing protein [bacterium]|nr:acetyl-CoA hydrolase/transferase C-terminal domain-containing protein [bacterium]
MGWREEYKRKTVTAEEAVLAIKPGDRVFTSGNAATSYVLLSALAKRKDELTDVEVTHVLLLGDDPLSKPEMAGHFRHNSLFVGPADRDAVNDGRADYIPVFLYEIPKLFASGEKKLDVAIIQTSMPDDHGYMSLGVETLATMAAIRAAKIVLAQVNENMPRTLGDCFVHVSKIHKLVEVHEDLPELPRPQITDTEKRIGQYVAQLVDNGATLQLGIGGIPDAVLASLADKRDLGIHTEMVSDGVIQAIESGIVTGSKKTLHPGKVIGTFALGSKHLYNYIDNNPMFEFRPSDYTNDPFIISRNENMVAVNSAIEVDITGQICADSIGTKIFSGFGGQVDFIRGAAYAKGGKPIIALPATAQGGKTSRIAPALKSGAGVVTTRADVHYIVTEFGIAYLHGKNLRERADALIAIAHPDFREELARAAHERFKYNSK